MKPRPRLRLGFRNGSSGDRCGGVWRRRRDPGRGAAPRATTRSGYARARAVSHDGTRGADRGSASTANRYSCAPDLGAHGNATCSRATSTFVVHAHAGASRASAAHAGPLSYVG